MKTKIYKICGVALALVLVFSLMASFLPINQAEAQAPGTTPNQWQAVTLPGLAVEKLRSSDVTDIAVAGDGATIYATTGLGALTDTLNATAVWETADEDLIRTGLSSAKLTAGLAGNDWAEVTLIPPPGITMSTVAALTGASDWSWWYYVETLGNKGTSMELFFRSTTDTDGWAEMTIMHQAYGSQPLGPPTTGSWQEQTLIGATTTGVVFGVEEDTTVIAQTPAANEGTIAAMVAALIALDSNAGNWVLTEVRPTLGWIGVGTTVAYIDDVTIAGVTYDLEQGAVLKSDSNGWMWDVLPTPAYTAPPRLVAVAPDDPNSIAIVDSSQSTATAAAGTVWISNNAGTTWAALTGVTGTAVNSVTDLAIGPTRAGTILDRDYVVAVADTGGGTVVGGDILFQGLNTAWVSCAGGTAFANNTYDFTSVAVSPGFLGDRTFVAVGSTTTDSFLLMIRTSDTANPVLINPPGAQSLTITTTDAPGDLGYQIITSSIALPSDFDPTSVPTGMRAWVGWTSVAVATYDDDVYRVDFQTTRKLETGAANGIHSVAYSGTIAGGTLIAGETTVTAVVYTTVWHTEDPNVSQPSWQSSAKSPTGTTNAVVGIDPTDPMVAYAGTGGVHSAFSSSANGAVSFNQIGMVDTTLTTLEDVMPTPDGSVIFLATNDGTHASLWKSTTPTGVLWERVRVRPAVTGYIIRLSPEYGDVPALYWCDAAGTDIQKSTSGGDVFSTRTAPIAIVDVAVESAEILYMAAGVNSYKSTNGAWFFNLPVNTGAVGAIFDLEMAPSYPAKPIPGYLIAGSITQGMVVRSPSAGDFWIPLTPTIAGGTNLQVIADEDFANNNTVYAGDATAGAGIWRYEVGTSTTWENIQTTADVDAVTANAQPGNVTGIAMRSGALYAAYDEAGGATSGALRTLVPDVPVIASWLWDNMDTGSAAAIFGRTPNALRAAGGSISLWAIDTVVPALMAYDDTMAAAKVELNVPEEVAFDSVTGRNTQFTISWAAISNATDYEVEIHNDPACSQLVTSSPNWAATTEPWYVPSNPLSPTWVVAQNTLVAGQDYFVRARIRDQTPNDAVRSPYSSVFRFSVKGGEMVQVTYLGVQPLGPVPAAINVPLSPGFTWSPYASSTRYEFQLATDPGFTDMLAEAKTSGTGYKYDGNLSPNTTYFWRARGIEPTTTDWSPVSSFTTEKKAEPPIVVEPAPAPPPPAPSVVTPGIIWAIIAIGAILVIAVIVLIVKTRAAR